MPDKSLTTTQQSTVKRHSESITHGVVGNTLYDLLRNGGPTAVTYVMALLAFMQGWSWPLIILASVGVFLALTIVVAIVITLRERHNRELLPSESEAAGVKFISDGRGTVDPSPETLTATFQAKEDEIKALKKELESAQEGSSTQQQEYAAEIEGGKRALEQLQSKYDTLLKQNRGLHAEFAKQTWLYNVAGKQAERIDQFVTLDRIERADFRFNDMDGWPFIRFHFHIVNKSVYDVMVELDTGARDSYVVFKDEGLRPEKFLGIPNNQLHIPHDSEGCLTIEQQLSAPQAHTLNRLAGHDDAIFYFDRLVINIKGSHNVEPQVEEKRLVIDKAISINNKLIPMRRRR